MLSAVIFDMDGVVIDSHPIHRRAWKRFLETVGIHVTQDDLEFVTQGGKREDILRHFLGPLTDEQVIAYGRRKEALFREEALEISPTLGLAGFLRELEEAGLAVGLASCGSRQRILYVLDRLGWTNRFAVIVAGDDVARGKPDPAIFRKAAERMRMHPANAVVFEDAVSGVQGAIAAGMKAIGVTSNGRTKLLLEAGASRVISDFCNIGVADLHQIAQFDCE